MKWLDFDPKRQEHAAELLSHVRFETIPASELVSEIQPVARMMLDPQCHRLLVDAMNYHLLPYQQNTLQSRRTKVRGSQNALLTIGGRPSLTERALSREVHIEEISNLWTKFMTCNTLDIINVQFYFWRSTLARCS